MKATTDWRHLNENTEGKTAAGDAEYVEGKAASRDAEPATDDLPKEVEVIRVSGLKRRITVRYEPGGRLISDDFSTS